MATPIPKVGDRVRVIKGLKKGEIYTVVECPRKYDSTNYRDGVWIKRPENKTATYFYRDRCEIMKDCVSTTGSSGCKYCKGTKRIQLFTSDVECEECK